MNMRRDTEKQAQGKGRGRRVSGFYSPFLSASVLQDLKQSTSYHTCSTVKSMPPEISDCRKRLPGSANFSRCTLCSPWPLRNIRPTSSRMGLTSFLFMHSCDLDPGLKQD